MKYKFWGIRINVTKYDVRFATKRSSNSQTASPNVNKKDTEN